MLANILIGYVVEKTILDPTVKFGRDTFFDDEDPNVDLSKISNENKDRQFYKKLGENADNNAVDEAIQKIDYGELKKKIKNKFNIDKEKNIPGIKKVNNSLVPRNS